MAIRWKKGTFTFFLMTLFVWIVFAFSTYNPDYIIYRNWYNETVTYGFTTRFEVLYTVLMMLCGYFGLTYQQFLMVISLVGYILIFSTVYKRCEHVNAFVVLYFIYPFFFDVTQVRNFMAMAIVFWGTRFLTEYNKKNVIAFIVVVVIAMGFHITAIMYCLYFVAFIPQFKKIVRICLWAFAAEIFCFFVGRSIINRLILIFASQEYLDAGSSAVKFLGYIAVAVAIVFVTVYYCKRNPECANSNIYVKIIPTILLAAPLLLFTSQAYRFIRNYSLVIYMAYLNESGVLSRGVFKTSGAKVMLGCTAMVFALFFAYKQLSGDMFDFLVRTIIENNLIFFNN